MDFACLEDARDEASRALVDLAKDVLPGSVRRTLSIEVRDGEEPVLSTSLVFEVQSLR